MNYKSEFLSIREMCCITTASCERFFIRAINLIYSIKKNFPDHPQIYIFDLGMSALQLRELRSIKGVKIEYVERFAPHWRTDYSWKLYIYNQIPTKPYLFHIDAGAVVLRNLYLIFLSLAKNDFFLIGQSQKLLDIFPDDYLSKLNIQNKEGLNLRKVFTAGVIGINRSKSLVLKIVIEAYDLSIQGYCLGYSKQEMHRDSANLRIIRDCNCFRHDQTIINLLVYKYFHDYLIHREIKYIGMQSSKSHKMQYIWNSRLDNKALKYIYIFDTNNFVFFILNRVIFISSVIARRIRKVLWKS